jgi:hypothetical protein
MTKLFLVGMIGATIVSCNNGSTDTSTTTKSDTTANTATTTTTYTAAEGDVSYRNGKVVVWRNNNWVVADEDVTLNDGVIVRRNGEVKRGDDVVVLKDGEVVDRSGRFFDDAGNAIEDAWQGAKKGVKKAGEEVKEVFSDKNDTDEGDKKDKDKK